MPFDFSFFDQRIDRQGTNSVKWSAPGLNLDGVIPMWVADMDFACAPAIQEAIQQRAAHPSYGYTYESDECRTAFCAYWQRRHGASVLPDHMLTLPTVVSGLRACIGALTQEGDGVIIQPPVYGPFHSTIADAGRRLMEAPLRPDNRGRYSMDLDMVEQCLKNGAKIMLLCNPHNPVSRLWSADELAALSSLLIRYNAVLVSDEIHADFVYPPGSFYSMLCIEAAASHTVCLSAPSKTYNIAGLKQATLVAKDKPMRQKIAFWLQQHGVVSSNLFAMVASKAAYTACDDWLDGLIAYLNRNRTLLTSQLAHELPDAMVTPIEATYLAWVHVQPYGTDQEALMASCNRHGVLPYSGVVYGRETGAGYIRINFGCPTDQLTEGLSRFAAAMHDTLKQQGAGR
ncbi:MAG: MalY/PatB family protein [Christensenellales bacterium]|jgi:cystathionine beta-lyase